MGSVPVGIAGQPASELRRREIQCVKLIGARVMTAEEYLEHAEECDRLAAIAKLAKNREALLTSAVMWRKLAADPARNDGAEAEPSTQTARPLCAEN
jgi:hypothetical protein